MSLLNIEVKCMECLTDPCQCQRTKGKEMDGIMIFNRFVEYDNRLNKIEENIQKLDQRWCDIHNSIKAIKMRLEKHENECESIPDTIESYLKKSTSNTVPKNTCDIDGPCDRLKHALNVDAVSINATTKKYCLYGRYDLSIIEMDDCPFCHAQTKALINDL